MHGNEVVVYAEPSRQTGPSKADEPWAREVIEASLIQGHSVVCGDFLRRGDDQIVVGWRGAKNSDPVGVRLYVRSKSGEWNSSLIDDGMACEDLEVADIDQ